MLSENLERLVLRYFEDLDTSFSLMCALLWRHGEIEALVGLNCPPEDYDTPDRYLRSVAALAFVKKLKGLFTGDEGKRHDRTIAKWCEGEVSCYKSNQRLYPYIPGLNLECDERVAGHLSGIRQIVDEILGPRPPELLEGRFGPGATFANSGLRATVPHKMSSDPTLTSDCVWFLPQFLGTAWGRYVASEKGLSFVRGNRFTCVPKTSLIDRSIAVEPSINVFYQLAVGRAMRARLRRRAGWDLDTAQAVHQHIAGEASVTREFATLDLSNASDTVAYNLVKLMLPHGWFEVCDALRSQFTTHHSLSNRWVKLEKFSSMGNGFTFELETVLFSAMAMYVSRQHGWAGILGQDTFVFGDDIIVKEDVVADLTALLHFCGFTLNEAKSFSGMSPFRESCGADYYVGADVRPSYLKELPSDVQGTIGVANRLSATYERVALMGGTIRRSAWHYAISRIPLPYRRCRGPKGLGDNVVWDEPVNWRVRWKHSIRYVFGLKAGERAVVPFSRFAPEVVLACATYGIGNVGTPVGGHVPVLEGVNPRGKPRSYVCGWLPYS